MKFTFYALRYDINKKEVVPFNIFDNIYVQEYSEKEIKKYKRSPKKYSYNDLTGFEALCEKIKSIIKWQEWSRVQYELSVGDPFCNDVNDLKKIDCYCQALPNIEIIARELLYQYRVQK